MNLSQWLSSLVPTRRTVRRPLTKTPGRLSVEVLEGREVPTAALNTIADVSNPSDKVLLVPLSLTSAPTGATVNYTATSANGNVSTSVISGNRALVLNVSGTDSNGKAFTGTMTLALFEDQAPIATGRIIELANKGFYNGLSFHRIIDDFVIQGGDPNGDGTGGSTLPDFVDEYNVGLTFNSPGLLAMANSGDDTNNSQFFITDLEPLDKQPQFLNFNHTILGQLTNGFDTFRNIITTKTDASDRPSSKVTINSATIIDDKQTAVLRITGQPGFVGTSKITVTANDGSGASTPEDFNVSFVVDTTNDRAFLGKLANQATTVGTAVSFQIPATDTENDKLTYTIRDTNFQTPSNVTVSIDQNTGRATLTPQAGFIGSINLLVGVRDQTPRNTPQLDAEDNYDTQLITLTVSGSIDLDPDSDTGPANDDNVTGDDTPTLTINAPTGQLVTLTINSGVTVNAVEGETKGTYIATLPSNALTVGPNTISGKAGDTDLSSLTLTYAPRLQNTYIVPGVRGTPQELTFDFLYSESDFRNEIGVVKVDENGAINGILPGQDGYIQALLQSTDRQTIFTPDGNPGDNKAISFNGGDRLAVYIIADSSAVEALARITVGSTDLPNVFVSLTDANPGALSHVNVVDDPLRSQALYAFEDLRDGGDRDYNDIVLIARPTGTTLSQGIRIPGVQGRDLSVTFQLQIANRSADATSRDPLDTASGELGLFQVDDENGAINGINPGEPGYAQAALSRRQILFSTGAAALTEQTVALPGGRFLGFYYVPNGTASDVLTRNPNNTSDGDVLAFFNFDQANPDVGVNHFRAFSPEEATVDAPAATDPFRFHMMGTLNGGPADFDDIVFTMNFNQE